MNLAVKKLTKISRSIYSSIVVILFVAMVATTFINVVLRFVIRTTVPFFEEFARFCFIWVMFISAVDALYKKELVGFDMLVSALGSDARRIIEVIGNLLVCVLCVIVAVFGIKICVQNWGWPAPSTKISYGLVGAVMPTCHIIMCVILLVRTGKTIASLIKRDKQ